MSEKNEFILVYPKLVFVFEVCLLLGSHWLFHLLFIEESSRTVSSTYRFLLIVLYFEFW